MSGEREKNQYMTVLSRHAASVRAGRRERKVGCVVVRADRWSVNERARYLCWNSDNHCECSVYGESVVKKRS